jgi:hypothetical protein
MRQRRRVRSVFPVSVEGAWRASLADDDGHWANFRVIRPDGTVRHLHSTGRVIARAGRRPVLVRGITLDLSERGPHGRGT